MYTRTFDVKTVHLRTAVVGQLRRWRILKLFFAPLQSLTGPHDLAGCGGFGWRLDWVQPRKYERAALSKDTRETAADGNQRKVF